MNKLINLATGLIIVTLLSKVLGFAREIVLMYAYGTSAYSDIYITAMSIPNVIFSAIGVALSVTFIPLYHEKFAESGKLGAINFTNNILNITIAISVLLSIVGYIFAEEIVKLFAMSFTGEKLAITVKFVRIIISSMIFIGISNIIKSYLEIKGNFIIPGLVGIPYNLIIIVSIVLSYKFQRIYILPIGVLIAVISQVIVQVPFAYRLEYRYKYKLNLKDEYILKLVKLVVPVFIGVAVYQINSMVDRSLASGLGDGIISALNNANRLNGFVIGIFIATISTIIYPTLSKLSSENDNEEFAKSVCISVKSIISLILPITIGAIVLSTPIVKILFERGAFNETSTILTSDALKFYSIGMIGFGLADIMSKVFYSLKDTKTPMINGAISMLINIVLNLILVRYMGHRGLAFSTSLASIISVSIYFIKLKQKIGYFGQDKIIKTTIKSLIASVMMGMIVSYSYKYIHVVVSSVQIGDLISLLICIPLGILTYTFLAIILKIEDVIYILNIVNEKIIKIRKLKK